jgi:ferredoxin-nitrate reductase
MAMELDPIFGTARELRAAEAPEPEKWIPNACAYCGVGCGLKIGVNKGQVVAVRGMKENPVNRGDLCLLGKNLPGMLYSKDRLLYPQVREGKDFKKVDWKTVVSNVAQKIKGTVAKHGPDSVALYVSASEYIEEYYIYNKLFKGFIGTNNVESSARLCWASGVVGLATSFGADSPPCSVADIELADLFVLAGYNMSSSKPVLFKRIVQAQKNNKAKMIVIDPRRTSTAERADIHLKVAPGSDLILFNALSHVMINEGLVNEKEVKSYANGFDELKAHVQKFTPEFAAQKTGLSRDTIVEMGRTIGKSQKGLFLWGQGLNQSTTGNRKANVFMNLAFLSGNIGKAGAGPLAITGQVSAMGLREVGSLPHLLPGFRTVTDEKARAEVAAVWGADLAKISPEKGKTIPGILKAIEEGKIKLLWIIHSNPASTFPNTTWARNALSKAETLIVQDSYHPTETTQYAHILLPGAQWAEKEGCLTNSERGYTIARKAVNPPGEARPDMDIVMDVAKELGFGKQFSFKNSEEVFEEYKLLTADRPCDSRGMTYARMEKQPGIQWPVPTLDHPGTPRRFLDRKFPGKDGKVMLHSHEHQDAAEMPDAEYPLNLITGLVQEHFHSRTRTGKIPQLAKITPEVFVEIHPDDAKKYNATEGAFVRATTRRGSVKARVRVTDAITKGSIFLPYHFGFMSGEDQAVNSLTNDAFDEKAKQPEYKACAVKIEKA